MPRARSIKPGFFKNEELAELGPEAMLLFAGLWTIADRSGRLEDRPKRIKAEILPYFRRVSVEKLLSQLTLRNFIVRYVVNGERYIAIPTWDKHQNPHIREAISEIPPPPEHSASTILAQDEAQPIPERAGLTPSSLTPSSLTPSSNGAAEGPQREEAPTIPALETARAAVAEIRKPAYLRDELFLTFKSEYEATGSPFIERDWLMAFDAWKILDFEQKDSVIAGFRSQIAAGRWRDPARVMRPVNYIREGEYKRAPPPLTATRTKQQEQSDAWSRA